MRIYSLLALAAIALLLTGCQTARPLYYWGHYETLAYLSYYKPEKATLETQREKLEADLIRCDNVHVVAHPGLHAQLGYVYFQLGRIDDAVTQFAAEKALFPESTTFMDRMISKAKGVTSS